VTAFVLSTNLYTFAQVSEGFFAWPEGTGEAEVIQGLNPGDIIVPKFSQAAAYGDDAAQRVYCQSIGLTYENVVSDYQTTIDGGNSAVPYLMLVTAQGPPDERQAGPNWARVSVATEILTHPLSTQEFLRIRTLPPEIAAQFKATVAQGRHLQEVPDSLVDSIREAANSTDRSHLLRRYTVVEAPTSEEAAGLLTAGGRPPVLGDQAFLVTSGGLVGLHQATAEGGLQAIGSVIEKTPEELVALIDEAKTKATDSDYFTPQRTVIALQELQELLDGPEVLRIIDDFAQFYDRYVLLDRKITQALDIAARVHVTSAKQLPESEDTDVQTEADEAAALHGLTVEAVRAQIPEGVVLPDAVLAEAVTALRSGKHLLIGGPPGTGKSTLAEALCRSVMGNQYDVATGTADWTTFDTIGGYIPTDEGLSFEPGLILRALMRGAWVVIDELNRADIDKAFGPLFTLLAATEIGPRERRRVVLPYRKGGRNVEIHWSESRGDQSSSYIVTPTWRLIGTLNLADKASLFQLSFAFLRRFAVLKVPLPAEATYRNLIAQMFAEGVVDQEIRAQLVECTLSIALGDRELGPAIVKDIAGFVSQGVVETAGGSSAYSDPINAFLTALRLYAVPQYEGATGDEIKRATAAVRAIWPDRPSEDFEELERAFESVGL
jgi:MoxR-like ATPase